MFEGTTHYLTAEFLDKNRNPQAPTTVTWQAHDVDTGNELQAATAIAAGETVEITLPPSLNAIINERKGKELRRITVIGTYGGDDAVVGQFIYELRNLADA